MPPRPPEVASRNRAGGRGGGGDDEEETSCLVALTPVAKQAVAFFGSLRAPRRPRPHPTPPASAKTLPNPTNDPRMANLATYIFPHFCGIFLTSAAFVMGYAAFRRNSPKLFPEITLPGFVSGCIWSVAQIGFFYANANLGMVVSFPLITVGPGLVGALWGVFVFREIVGLRNYILLACAFAFAIAASVCIALSKQ